MCAAGTAPGVAEYVEQEDINGCMTCVLREGSPVENHGGSPPEWDDFQYVPAFQENRSVRIA